MVHYLILCRSLTYAQKMAQTLERAGIGAWLCRTPASISPSGCSYSVKIARQEIDRAVAVIGRFDMPYLINIYTGTEGQEYQEVEL